VPKKQKKTFVSVLPKKLEGVARVSDRGALALERRGPHKRVTPSTLESMGCNY
jgi:hypothetical protein